MSENCGCYKCTEERNLDFVAPKATPWMHWANRMFLCAKCGNKRCPHATDHRLACTGSNEPGQPGSNYQ